MKLVTWNINGIRAAIKKGLAQKLEALDADIIAFQEIKCQDEIMESLFAEREAYDLFGVPQHTKHTRTNILSEHDAEVFSRYHAFWHTPATKKGYSGTALLVKRDLEPDIHDTVFETGIEALDTEGRVTGIKCVINGKKYCVVCVYFPQGGREGRVRFKIDFYAQLVKKLHQIRLDGYYLIVCGDMNTTVTDIDLARPKENRKTTGCLPHERVALQWFIDRSYFNLNQLEITDEEFIAITADVTLNLHDAYRALYPHVEGSYTYWDQITRARERNVGWRIDYWLIDNAIRDQLHDCTIRNDIYGSDHCPVELHIEL